MSHPGGSVLTFLFTDIEGSTRRWQEDQATMADTVARHDEVLTGAIGGHAGRLVKQTGDGVFAVFADPAEAAAAAIEAQSRFTEGDDLETLPVRMALHSGTAVGRGGDFFGNEVNRAARLMDTANGGQILVSAVTAQLVRERLPEDASLEDLGSHRLRDLAEPVSVYQLTSSGLPAEFPPLRSLDGYPNNLPVDVSSFVGRREDMLSLERELQANRLVSVTGAGGSGKTRLALQIAARVLPEFEDGAWFVDLAGLSDLDLVPLEIASTLNIRERAGRRWSDVLVSHLTPLDLLLILDNCEHLLDASASIVNTLLRAAPNLKIMTTTREALNVPGEVSWAIPTMELPDESSGLTLEELLQHEAPQLFVERVLAARPGLELDDSHVTAIVEICRRLDGLPLALELAAARARALSVEDIAGNLEDRFTLLSGGSRAALPRHQTLEGAVDWSYEMLDETEREAFLKLSVFSGGFDLEAARALAGPGVLPSVTSLVEKSLLVASSTATTRYRMLETVSEFARKRLGEDLGPVRDAHLDWAASLAQRAASELDGKKQRMWLRTIALDIDDLRAAMQWALDDGDPAQGLAIAGSLYRYWYIRGVREGRRWLDLFLELDPPVPEELKARALFAAGSLTLSQGDYEKAAAVLKESAAIFEELGERRGGAYALHYLIRALWGSVHVDEMRRMIDEDLAEFRAVEDPVGINLTLLFDALWYLERGAPDEIESVEELRSTAEAIGAPQLLAHSYEIPGVVAWFQGDLGRSAALLSDAARIYQELQNPQCAAHCLENASGWAAKAERFEDAALLLGSADALRADIGIPTPAFENVVYDQVSNSTRNRLGDDFDPAHARGRALSMDEALERVVELTGG